MNFRNLYLRTSNLLINPASEFDRIAIENQGIKEINKATVVPYAIFISLCALIGSIFTHIRSPLDSFVFVFLNALIVFLIIFLQTYFSGKLIAILGRNIHISNRSEAVHALVAYAQIPFYLVLAFTKVFPSLIFLIFLGLYSGYLFYIGIDILLKISSVKKMQFLILSMLIMIVLFIAISELFSLLYSEIINLFSTFAVL